ncbi:MAG: hypothetical protein MR008_02040 [Aerococcus sp.]|nr:hypothetical protein [Aerococcus sp.]
MHTASPEATKLTKQNEEHATKLTGEWQRYYFQCQAYIDLNAKWTIAIERELAKLIHRLEKAQKENIAPDVRLKRDPEAYARAILRYTKAEQPLIYATTIWKMIALFIGLTLLLYALFQAIHGWAWYGHFSDGLAMPVPISILGLSLQTALAFLTTTLLGQFIYHSAYGRNWRTGHNIGLLVGMALSLLLFILLPFLSLYYRVFVIEVPAWLIFGIALIIALVKIFTDYIPVADYIQQYIDDRARKQEQADHKTPGDKQSKSAVKPKQKIVAHAKTPAKK